MLHQVLDFLNYLFFGDGGVQLAFSWAAFAAAAASFLGSMLNKKKGGKPMSAMDPAFQGFLAKELLPWVRDTIKGGAPGPGFSLSVPASPIQQYFFSRVPDIWQQAQSSFFNPLARISSGFGLSKASGVLEDIANRRFLQSATAIRTAAGAAGAAQSDVVRQIAQTKTDIDLGLARARLEFLNADLSRQVEAARVGIAGLPTVLQTLGAFGQAQRGIDVDNLVRQYQEFVTARALPFQLAMASLGSPMMGVGLTTSTVRTPFLARLGEGLLAGVTAYNAYGK